MEKSSSFDHKYELAMAELLKSPISNLNSNPPFQKILRKLGVRTRPPHYRSFLGNFAIIGIGMGILSGFVMWIGFRSFVPQSISFVAPYAGALGVFFGLFMAVYYWFSARHSKLSRWMDLVEDGDA